LGSQKELERKEGRKQASKQASKQERKQASFPGQEAAGKVNIWLLLGLPD